MPKVDKCRSCGSSCLVPVLDLGKQPWCNDFLPKYTEAEIFPLELVFCPECFLAQLSYTVPKEKMFSNHTYVSGTTKTLANHFYDLARYHKTRFDLQPEDLILDIGGNDGTQLLQYKKLGLNNLHNVESANNIAEISRNAGITTHNAFFNEEWVDEFLKSHPKAKLISAAGVFFHLEELHSVIRGIKKFLDIDGTLVVQFMYLRDIVDNLAFDAIYHEHLCYYTLESLGQLLLPFGLMIYDANRSPIHGGSVVAKIGHIEKFAGHKASPHYIKLLEKDHVGLNDLLSFAETVEKRKPLLQQVLYNLKVNRKKVYGYGAPAKGNTLLNYFDISSWSVEKLVEINKLKVGLVAPGSNIPIVLEDKDDLPDYYLVLAWNFLDEILEKNKDIRARGVKFITPFPEIKVY